MTSHVAFGYLKIQKGEQAYTVLALVMKRVDPEEAVDPKEKEYKIVGFKTVSVFDISQTKPIEGKDVKPLDSLGLAKRLEKDAPEKLKK